MILNTPETDITIIDYGIGNLGSVYNMLKKVGAKVNVTADKRIIEKTHKIVLPGVGSFDYAIENLNKSGLFELLNYKVIDEKAPILGICLGMQLLFESSEEGSLPGFGWIAGTTRKFQFTNPETRFLKIPHMGWNSISQQRKSALLFNSDFNSRYYFVHSYYVVCSDNADIIAKTNYGINFTSVVEHQNILGVQFHPEKSHTFGKQLLKNFMENY